MRNVVVLVGLAVLAATASGHASTSSPCRSHIATAPTITMVNDNIATLSGSAQIGGCPLVLSTTPDSLTLTVCLQTLTPTGWQDVSCNGPVSKAWNRYWRYARQLGLSVTGTCAPGAWRTDARGGDGWGPAEWASSSVTFAASDQYACGEPGGA